MQQSKEERVHDVFEKISDKYDVMNSVISFQRHKSVAERNDANYGCTTRQSSA